MFQRRRWNPTADIFFIVIDGVRVAKRGRLGTPEALTWVTLVPGWGIRAAADGLVMTHRKGH